MKICLIIYDNGSHAGEFPLGMGYISAVCREAGHDVTIYSQDVYHYPESHLTGFLDSNSFDFVGVSTVAGYYQYRKIQAISKAVNLSENRKHFIYGIGGILGIS